MAKSPVFLVLYRNSYQISVFRPFVSVCIRIVTRCKSLKIFILARNT